MNNKNKFLAAKVPDLSKFKGKFAVKLVLPILPNVRFFGHQKVVPDDIAKNAGGYNLMLNRLKIGNFRVEVGPSSLKDGLEVLKIIYDDQSNPFWLRGLVDELREDEQGNYFCRGIYKTIGKPLNVMYFTMIRLCPYCS